MKPMAIKLQKYDAAVTEAPFEFIDVSERIVVPNNLAEQIRNDETGTRAYQLFSALCRNKGFTFKFYSTSSEPDLDYEICVYGEFEQNELNKLWRL